MIAFGVLAVAVAIGAAVQRTIGFGFALVAAPVLELELVNPGSVPVTVLCLAFPMTVGMAVGERTHVDGRGSAGSLSGGSPGRQLGWWS